MLLPLGDSSCMPAVHPEDIWYGFHVRPCSSSSSNCNTPSTTNVRGRYVFSSPYELWLDEQHTFLAWLFLLTESSTSGGPDEYMWLFDWFERIVFCALLPFHLLLLLINSSCRRRWRRMQAYVFVWYLAQAGNHHDEYVLHLKRLHRCISYYICELVKELIKYPSYGGIVCFFFSIDKVCRHTHDDMYVYSGGYQMHGRITIQYKGKEQVGKVLPLFF